MLPPDEFQILVDQRYGLGYGSEFDDSIMDDTMTFVVYEARLPGADVRLVLLSDDSTFWGRSRRPTGPDL